MSRNETDGHLHWDELLERLGSARRPRLPAELVDRTIERLLGDREARELASRSSWAGMLADLRARLEEIRARLAVDSAAPLAAVRGEAGVAARTFLYETEEWMVSVSLDRPASGGGRLLRGQIIPRGDELHPPESRAIVHGEGAPVRSVTIDQLGGFVVEALPERTVELAIVLGDRFMVVGPLPSPASPPSEHRPAP